MAFRNLIESKFLRTAAISAAAIALLAGCNRPDQNSVFYIPNPFAAPLAPSPDVSFLSYNQLPTPTLEAKNVNGTKIFDLSGTDAPGKPNPKQESPSPEPTLNSRETAIANIASQEKSIILESLENIAVNCQTKNPPYITSTFFTEIPGKNEFFASGIVTDKDGQIMGYGFSRVNENGPIQKASVFNTNPELLKKQGLTYFFGNDGLLYQGKEDPNGKWKFIVGNVNSQGNSVALFEKTVAVSQIFNPYSEKWEIPKNSQVTFIDLSGTGGSNVPPPTSTVEAKVTASPIPETKTPTVEPTPAVNIELGKTTENWLNGTTKLNDYELLKDDGITLPLGINAENYNPNDYIAGRFQGIYLGYREVNGIPVVRAGFETKTHERYFIDFTTLTNENGLFVLEKFNTGSVSHLSGSSTSTIATTVSETENLLKNIKIGKPIYLSLTFHGERVETPKIPEAKKLLIPQEPNAIQFAKDISKLTMTSSTVESINNPFFINSMSDQILKNLPVDENGIITYPAAYNIAQAPY